ncbi:MAG TPA: hypothetical protein VI030_09065, partial [Propionibacteriaceae bacterium]
DDQSALLNQLRERALASVDDPNTTLAIFEWSAEDGCAINDWDAIAWGMPGLGYTVSHEAILSSLAMDAPPGIQDRGDVPERPVARRTRFPAGVVLLRAPRPDHQGRRAPSLIMSRKTGSPRVCVTQCRGLIRWSRRENRRAPLRDRLDLIVAGQHLRRLRPFI